MGQWKHSKVENPEWNKKAYSWPVGENGDINEEFDWPMEGYFIPYAPPMKKPKDQASQSGIVLVINTADIACVVYITTDEGM